MERGWTARGQYDRGDFESPGGAVMLRCFRLATAIKSVAVQPALHVSASDGRAVVRDIMGEGAISDALLQSQLSVESAKWADPSSFMFDPDEILSVL